MINLKRKEDCCGCGACEQVCPKRCISLLPDAEGYLYPKVDESSCVNCSLCEQVCPVINQDALREPLKVYAAKNKDEQVRKESSSGGIFTIIAEKIIALGGVVFGVKFDENWNVIFDYTENLEGLSAFRRSKYVQAKVGYAYKNVKKFLQDGRVVLFAGTPCHIAGLRHFLRKDYENLFLVDVICSGVPSPKLWQKYLNEEISRLIEKYSKPDAPLSRENIHIDDISFRDKSLEWKAYSFKIAMSAIDTEGKKTPLPTYINRNSAYMQAMFRYLDLRPICYECPFKSCKSQSDITMADYWGIDKLHPAFLRASTPPHCQSTGYPLVNYTSDDVDKMGVSMLYLNTAKANVLIDFDKLIYLETNYDEAKPFNCIVTSSKRHLYRDEFYRNFDKSESVIRLLEKYRFTKGEKFRMILRKFFPKKAYEFFAQIWRALRK